MKNYLFFMIAVTDILTDIIASITLSLIDFIQNTTRVKIVLVVYATLIFRNIFVMTLNMELECNFIIKMKSFWTLWIMLLIWLFLKPQLVKKTIYSFQDYVSIKKQLINSYGHRSMEYFHTPISMLCFSQN